MKKIIDSLRFFFELLKVNKLTRLITGILISIIFLKLSEYNDFWFYPSLIFAIYPLWLTFWLIIYAWIINPIRENMPNSKFTKNIIPKIDKLVDR